MITPEYYDDKIAGHGPSAVDQAAFDNDEDQFGPQDPPTPADSWCERCESMNCTCDEMTS